MACSGVNFFMSCLFVETDIIMPVCFVKCADSSETVARAVNLILNLVFLLYYYVVIARVLKNTH
jgi:hypothetical protein